MGKIAAAQMVSSSNVSENLNALDNLFQKACDTEAEILVLPENFAFMGKEEVDKYEVAEVFGQGVIQDTVIALAKRYGIWVLAGTLPIKSDGTRLKSASIFYDEKGKVVGRYDKIHLFDVRVSETEAHKESTTIEPGDNLVVVETPAGKMGLSVCYDLRFPELYQLLLKKGAEILAVPAAFTAVTGKAHWEVLLRARAVENLCYLVASDQGGHHDNGRDSHGHSMIIEPWGQILAEHASGPGVIAADIDLERMYQIRKQFPCNDHHILNR